jgi:hypothetical protein
VDEEVVQADLSRRSLQGLEAQLRRVEEAIRTISLFDGLAGTATRDMALREVAALSARRRLIVAELGHRRAALATWQADHALVSSPGTPDP